MHMANTTDRRDFLNILGKTTVGMFMAYSFGCSMQSKSDSKLAIVYASRYGATSDTASWVAEGMGGDVTLLDIENVDFDRLVKEFDHLVLGSGVWTGGVHQRLKEFVATYSEQLQNKVLGSFVVCGSDGNTKSGRKRIAGYLAGINGPLLTLPEHVANFGGRLVLEKLSPEDRTQLTMFYQKYLQKELEAWDRTDPEKTKDYGRLFKM